MRNGKRCEWKLKSFLKALMVKFYGRLSFAGVCIFYECGGGVADTIFHRDHLSSSYSFSILKIAFPNFPLSSFFNPIFSHNKSYPSPEYFFQRFWQDFEYEVSLPPPPPLSYNGTFFISSQGESRSAFYFLETFYWWTSRREITSRNPRVLLHHKVSTMIFQGQNLYCFIPRNDVPMPKNIRQSEGNLTLLTFLPFGNSRFA